VDHGQLQLLFVRLLSEIVHIITLFNCNDAVPFITPPSAEICTFLLPTISDTVTAHPLIVRVPVPVATTVPLQQNRYAPVFTFTSTTFPGFELSCTHKLNIVTGNEHIAVFPDASVAVHVTEVVPCGNIDPDGGTHVTVTPEQLSVATGVA